MEDNLRLGLIFTVTGAGMAWYSHHEIGKQVESLRWPSTKGKITYVKRKGEGDHDADGYMISISYEYWVKEKKYTGSEIEASGKSIFSSEEYDKKMKGLYHGAEVDVYYDPSNPQSCLLVPGDPEDAETGKFFLVGIAMFLAGLGLIGWSVFKLEPN